MGKLFKSVADIVPVKNKGTETLGEGSFGKVRMVSHRENPNKFYAMKDIQVRSEKDRTQVFKEINLHQTLIHENIIRFEDFIDNKKEILIFLELAPNGDLFSHVNKVRCSDTELTKFFYETCRAIQYMHNKSLMHRDLKPENILLDTANIVKVCDFGWSAEFSELVPRETLCGTFEYMAPEVLLRRRQTTKTDVWALGILLYELFHGHAPFRGRRLEEVLDQISKNTLAFKKTLNPQIKDLIVRILKFYPHERPTVDQILESDFIRDYMSGMTTKRERSLSPRGQGVGQAQPGAFTKVKDGKVETFLETGNQFQEAPKDSQKPQAYYNLYSERPPLEMGGQSSMRQINVQNQGNVTVQTLGPNMFGSFSGPSSNSQLSGTKPHFQSFVQPSTNSLSGSKANLFEGEKGQKAMNSSSAQNTPQKQFHPNFNSQQTQPNNVVSHHSSNSQAPRSAQRVNLAQISRQPQLRIADNPTQRYQSTGPEKIESSFKAVSSRGIEVSNRSVEESKNLGGLKRFESQHNIQVKTLTKNTTDPLKAFLSQPQLVQSFSQHCVPVNQRTNEEATRLYKAKETSPPPTVHTGQPLSAEAHNKAQTPSASIYTGSTRFINFHDSTPKMQTASDLNRTLLMNNPVVTKKAVSSNPNPIYRKIGTNDRSYGGFAGLNQRD